MRQEMKMKNKYNQLQIFLVFEFPALTALEDKQGFLCHLHLLLFFLQACQENSELTKRLYNKNSADDLKELKHRFLKQKDSKQSCLSCWLSFHWCLLNKMDLQILLFLYQPKYSLSCSNTQD